MSNITSIDPRQRLSLSQSRSKQRGITIIEVAIFLGISVIVIAGALFGVKYFNKSKVANEVTFITDMRANVESFGSRVGLFTSTNSSLAALVGQNFFPSQMVSGTTAAPVVTNQWGGSLTVAVGTIVNAGDSLTFTSTGVPNSACTELGTSLDAVASMVTINTTSVKANGAASDPTSVATACVANDNNKLIYTLAK